MTYYVTFQWTAKAQKLQEVQQGVKKIKKWLDGVEDLKHALVHLQDDAHLVMLLQEWTSKEKYDLAQVEVACADVINDLKVYTIKEMEVKSYT